MQKMEKIVMKNDTNDHLEEYRYKENGKKINNKEKDRKLDENEIYENVSNECFKDDKKGKNNKKNKILKFVENNININKFKLYENCYIDDFIENNNLLENIKNNSIDKKYKIKFKRIYIIYFYYIILNIIFFSQLIKCYDRKIELAYSYINLKIIGNGDINIFSNDYYEDKPNIVIINNETKYNDSEVQNHYNF